MLDAKVTEIKNKISGTNSLVKKTDFHKKVTVSKIKCLIYLV